eukprot:1159832-Pelagomonas_calceolata.AAC.12
MLRVVDVPCLPSTGVFAGISFSAAGAAALAARALQDHGYIPCWSGWRAAKTASIRELVTIHASHSRLFCLPEAHSVRPQTVTLLVLVKRQPPVGKKLLIIGTSSTGEIMESMGLGKE